MRVIRITRTWSQGQREVGYAFSTNDKNTIEEIAYVWINENFKISFNFASEVELVTDPVEINSAINGRMDVLSAKIKELVGERSGLRKHLIEI